MTFNPVPLKFLGSQFLTDTNFKSMTIHSIIDVRIIHKPVKCSTTINSKRALLLLDAAVRLAFDLRDALRFRFRAEHEVAHLRELGAARSDFFNGEVVHLERLGLGDFVLAHLRGLEQLVDGTLKLVCRL